MIIVQGYFSLIRWCPDLLRDEWRNLGVILSDPDSGATHVRPLPPSALPAAIGRQGIVAAWLSGLKQRSEQGRVGPADLEEWAATPMRSLHITSPRPVVVIDGDWAATLDHLWSEYAKPPSRPYARSAVEVLARRLNPLIRANAIHAEYSLSGMRTGVPRVVDFFANSRANTALDVVKLSIGQADEIMRRADAEAFKVEDVTQSTGIAFAVFCEVDPEGPDAQRDALKVIESTGARLFTDLDQATDLMETTVAAGR